jgi:hypothetical protein
VEAAAFSTYLLTIGVSRAYYTKANAKGTNKEVTSTLLELGSPLMR